MFRIYTEATPYVEEEIRRALTEADVIGATVLYGAGVWRGQEEPCAVVELVDVSRGQAVLVAESLKATLQQEAVLLVEIEEKHWLV